MSSKLSVSIVQKIAQLSRLSNSPSTEFLEHHELQMSNILGYMEELNEVDTTGVDPLGGNRTISLHQLREDIPETNEEKYLKIRANILSNFPHKQGNLLVVPGIFE